MQIYGVLIAVVILNSSVLTHGTIDKPYPGAVSANMIKLAFDTTNVMNDMQDEWDRNFKLATATFLGAIEVAITSAMDQLSDSIFNTHQQLATNECAPTWNIDDLLDRIQSKLSDCSKDMTDSLAKYRSNTDDISESLQNYFEKLRRLVSDCQLTSRQSYGLNDSVAKGSVCFARKIAEINQQIARSLNSGNTLISEMRQQSKMSIPMIEQCNNKVVREIQTFLSESLDTC